MPIFRDDYRSRIVIIFQKIISTIYTIIKLPVSIGQFTSVGAEPAQIANQIRIGYFTFTG